MWTWRPQCSVVKAIWLESLVPVRDFRCMFISSKEEGWYGRTRDTSSIPWVSHSSNSVVVLERPDMANSWARVDLLTPTRERSWVMCHELKLSNFSVNESWIWTPCGRILCARWRISPPYPLQPCLCMLSSKCRWNFCSLWLVV